MPNLMTLSRIRLLLHYGRRHELFYDGAHLCSCTCGCIGLVCVDVHCKGIAVGNTDDGVSEDCLSAVAVLNEDVYDLAVFDAEGLSILFSHVNVSLCDDYAL